MSNKKSILVVLLGITTLTYLLLLTQHVASQEFNRVIDTVSYTDTPVKIASVENLKGEIDLGKSFADDDNWFKGLSITVLNSSGKNITHVTLGLLFPKPEGSEAESQPPFYYSIAVGRDPRSATSRVDNSIKLLPGETSEISLSDKAYNSIKESLRQLNYPRSIKNIKVVTEKIFFDDGTAWYGGLLYRQNLSR